MAESRVTRAALLLCLGVVFGGVLAADDNAAQLERLRERIDQLQRNLNETVGRRDVARDALQTEERRINDLQRELQNIDVRLRTRTRALAQLQRREGRERRTLREQLLALEREVRAAYTVGREPYLKLLLNQESPAAATRVLTYYRYFNEARLARIADARAALARLDDLEVEIGDEAEELARLRADQAAEHERLDDSRRRRAEMVANLNRDVADQTQEIARLRADEERLTRLLQELKTLLPEAVAPPPGSAGRFASRKGRLALPASGRVVARFGQTKGVGNMTWRGIFVAGKEGDNVYAVARGRVAFAEWLRGFGLLLILDHGDGYMTLYGHNGFLHRRVGEWVEAGQPVATIGNTGDAPGTGVYFEIRHNGVPHDPLQWCTTARPVASRSRR